MKPKDVAVLLVLSAIWGASFLFIRIASPALGPVLLIEVRVLIAGIALLCYTLLTRSKLDMRKRWKHYFVIGIINSAIPFTLIATAELHLTAGLAAILNATSPLFGAVVAALWLKEALTLPKIVGLFLSLLGVAVLVGWGPVPLSATLAFSVAASLTAAAFYGLAGVYIKIFMRGASPLALTTSSQLGAGLFLFPFTLAIPIPTSVQHVPSLSVVIAVAMLALLCTSFAYLLYFRLIADVGPTRALTVTFLSPAFGIFWGAIFLGESVTWSTLVGFAIILVGVGFVTGILKSRRVQLTDKQEGRISS